MENNLQKIYPTDYNLLIAQNLWQPHYQILSIIFLKKFIKLNVNTDTMIRNVKLMELNINITTAFLNTQTLCCNENYEKIFNKNLKKQFFNTYKFSKHDNNKFILLLRKGVYPYEQIVD